MEDLLNSLLVFIFMVLYFAAIAAGFCIVLAICAIAFVGGAISGMLLGIFMGIKNYFAALFSQVKLRQ